MSRPISRRTFVGAIGVTAALAALAGCAPPGIASARILPGDPLVAEYESRRRSSGTTVLQSLTAGALTSMVASNKVNTWGYGDSIVAPTIRAAVGDILKTSLSNNLTEPTSIHWHGLALRNNADGVPDLTQKAIAAGTNFEYSFRVPNPGTYWYHSHVEMQRERALYGALIVDDPAEPLSYDSEWVIVLDDWLDGISGTPDDILAELSAGMSGMGMSANDSNMLMASRSDFLGGDAGDVKIPEHLFNGRTDAAPNVLMARAGDRIRLRIINAAGDTAYRVGVPGQKLTLTHADGFAVEHAEVDAVVIAMGERVDALIVVTEGDTPVLALPEGKDGRAVGVISTSGRSPIPFDKLPASLDGVVTDGGQLSAAESVLLPSRSPDRVHELKLTGTMMKYNWGINGRAFDLTDPYNGAFDLRLGERVQVNIVNETTMWHPVHLHGHTFQLADGGARKDTVIVRPKQTVTLEFDADNPGQWLTHCHNAYHAARGMMGVFSYVK